MAAFKNRKVAKKIAARRCDWCGWDAGRRHAAHIVDEQKSAGEGQWNALALCPNCSTVFDELIRPKLYRALIKWKPELEAMLPQSWRKDNKISEAIESVV
jgi:hypothetical protein